MLDIRRIRKNPEEVVKALEKRHGDYPIDKVLELDEKRRSLLAEVEGMKSKQNSVSKEIPKLKKEGKDPSALLTEMKELSSKIKEMDAEVKDIDLELKDLLLHIPNTPHESVIEGKTDEDNIEIRKWGEPTNFDFEPKAHWDIGSDLDILDFERASKLTGARFSLFKGAGALLERALINFMIDMHTTDHGYTEVSTPFMVNRDSMIGT
ncbi:MAG TPA: serine--tRNA ligase, partial [Schnuerera sp.]|nr:serine--tRNA ligase [Schnuerera sp.]